MSSSASDQAVIVQMRLSDDEFGSPEERQHAIDVEDRLREALADAAAEYDGHEFGEGWCRFYIYGDNANDTANLVLAVLREADLSRRSFYRIVKRFGPPGARQEEVHV